MEQKLQARILEPQAWAVQNYGNLDLGDVRRTRRAVAVARALAAQPNGSLPVQLGSWGELKAAYRLLNNPHITPPVNRPTLAANRSNPKCTWG